jgi:hypothetical protein
MAVPALADAVGKQGSLATCSTVVGISSKVGLTSIAGVIVAVAKPGGIHIRQS